MENALMSSRHSKKFDKNYSGEERYEQYLGDSGLLIVERKALLLMEILNTKEFERTRDVIQIDHKVSEDMELTVLVTSNRACQRTSNLCKGSSNRACQRTSNLCKGSDPCVKLPGTGNFRCRIDTV